MPTAILNPFYPDISFPLKGQSPRPRTLPQKGLPLEWTCWLYGVIGNAVLVLPFLALLFVLTPDPGLITMMHAYFVGIVAYTIWAFVQIWTCASEHDGDRRLAFVAKLYVVLGSMQIAIFSMQIIVLS